MNDSKKSFIELVRLHLKVLEVDLRETGFSTPLILKQASKVPDVVIEEMQSNIYQNVKQFIDACRSSSNIDKVGVLNLRKWFKGELRVPKLKREKL